MKTLASRLSSAAVLLLAVSACSTQAPVQTQSTAPMLSRAAAIVKQAESQGETNVQIMDVSKGQRTNGAAIALTLKYAQAGDFATKSANGTAPIRANNISSYRAYLYECTTPAAANYTAGSETDLNAGGSGCTHIFDAPVTGNGLNAQTLVFANVPANTLGSSYFVGVVALNGAANVVVNNGATKSGGYRDNNIGWASGGPLSLTTAGGDGAGSVSVDTNNAVSAAANLGATINLPSGIGAQLGADVSVTNGAGTTGPITAS